MRNQLRDWYFDVSDDGYGVYKDFLESFYNFVRCPADSMETSGSNNLVLTGETFYGGRVSISGISLITKISSAAKIVESLCAIKILVLEWIMGSIAS